MYSNESSSTIQLLIVLQLIIIIGIIGICLIGTSIVKYGINDHYEKIHEYLLLIIKNQKTMSEQLNAIKADLQAAQDLQLKIKADVTLLHSKIDALGDAPTAAELAEVKELSGNLVTSLQGVDDQTPE